MFRENREAMNNDSPDMKRITRIALWSGLGVLSYLLLYFSTVQAALYKSPGPVTPLPAYGWPSDSDVAHAVFGPAHFIDATLLRRGYWAPRHTSVNPAAALDGRRPVRLAFQRPWPCAAQAGRWII
jgi:hypothetical protein